MEPATRARSGLLATLVFVINGFSPTLLFFLAGALDLVGSATQEIYLIPGFLIGGVIFTLLGSAFSLIRHGIVYGLVTFLVLYAVLVTSVFYYKTLTPVEGVAYSMIATSFCMPFVTAAASQTIPGYFNTRRTAKGVIMGIAPLVISLVLAVIYVAMSQSGIQEVLLIVLILVILLTVAAGMVPGGNRGKNEEVNA